MKNIVNIKFVFLFVILCNIIVDISHKMLLQNIAFKSFDGTELTMWISIINLLLLLPFVMLFTTSGYLSDKYKKSNIFIYGSLSSLVLSILMVIAYQLENFYIAMGILFLLGVQSAIYSPAKFGLIKQIFGKENLNKGNSLVQSISMIGILFTMAIYSFLFESMYNINDNNINSIMNSMNNIVYPIVIVALIEFTLSYIYFKNINLTFNKSDKELKINNLCKGIYFKENIKHIVNNEFLLLPIIGLSVFWAISQGLIAIFPSYVKEFVGLNDVFVINMIIACSGIGIAIGSSYYNFVKEKFINLSLLPFATIGMLSTLIIALQISDTILLGFMFMVFGIFGGLFVVPLNSLIQFNSAENELGTILAGNNWFQSFAMILMLVFTTSMSILMVNSEMLMYSIILITAIGSLYTLYKLPHPIIFLFVKIFVGLQFKLKVNGLKNIPSEGGVLLLGNHISWIDWAILQLSMPRKIHFVMYKGIYDKWYLKWLFKNLPIIPISNGASKSSILKIASILDKGEVVGLFPEGMISWNGHLGEFKKGFELILEKTSSNVSVHAFHLDGLFESMFSRANKKYLEDNATANITVDYSAKILNPNISNVKQEVMRLSVKNWNNKIHNLNSISEEILKSMLKNKDKIMVSDSTGLELSGKKFLTASFSLSSLIKDFLINENNVGVLVPSTSAGAIVNMSLLSLGKTIININYTAQLEAMIIALKDANVNKILASKKFISKIKTRKIDIDFLLKDFDVIYLEDLMPKINKIKALFNLCLINFLSFDILKLLFLNKINKNQTAFILFSSGSEGVPKGVELTHNNILSNVKQSAVVLDLKNDDIVLSSLPLFHAFGITVTTILPLVEGVHMTAHPDPTDGLGIAKLVFKNKATIMCGTSTFLRLYTINKKINPLMFDSLRIVIAGAEKLNEKVKNDFKIKFNKSILEGYGATETSPITSCNLPNKLTENLELQLGFKEGSVGLPLPGTHIIIVDPIDLESYKEDQFLGHPFTHGLTINKLGVEEEGMVLISGPQVMKGYLNNINKTNESIVIIDDIRYYITGDKGKLDKDGFLTIVDRYSRFAKIGGEMISLGALEQKFNETISPLNEYNHIDFLATVVKDDKKGERIIMLITKTQDLTIIKKLINDNFENKLMIPSTYLEVDEIPKLGSGKKDFKGAQNLALSLLKE